ncbi:hypothetical protein SDC9_81950 [bioreactor metagenome]|uniref:Uncharacterized protein n=1 Tax=bioreactor metagenome TaxID=1076179 RepID=A0A644Z464_9ZZZZ
MALEDGDGAVNSNKIANRKVVGKIIVDEINQWCNVRSGPELEYTIIGKAKKNVVYHAEKVGKVHAQKLIIHYNGIGAIDVPDIPCLAPQKIQIQTRKGVAVSNAAGELKVEDLKLWHKKANWLIRH